MTDSLATLPAVDATVTTHGVTASAEAAPRLAPRTALELVAPEMAALTEDRLLSVNLDVVSSVVTARGAMPEIRRLLPQIEQHLPTVDRASIDKIETYALALLAAQGLYRGASSSPEDLPRIIERATVLRDTFLADASALIRRGHLDGKAIEGRPRGIGHKALINELSAISNALRMQWSKIKTRTALEYAELDEADDLTERITAVLGLREQAPSVTVTEAMLQRQRAYTLFVRAYDQARKCATFLRWDAGDVDSIVPSLYAGRGNGGRRKSEASANGSSSETSDGSSSEPTNEGPLAPNASAAQAQASTLPALAKGFPGNDPFAPA